MDPEKSQPHENSRVNVTGAQLFHRLNDMDLFAGLDNPNPDEEESIKPVTIGSRTSGYDELD